MSRPAVRVSASPATGFPDDPVATVALDAAIPRGHRVHRGATRPPDVSGRRTVEVIVDGWRFELVVEDASRAALRDRASRDRDSLPGGGGPLEIRAIIPGRVLAVAVGVGDHVEAGQALLAVEAMKMQNELRAPRAGAVVRVAATAGATVELGDVLVVIE